MAQLPPSRHNRDTHTYIHIHAGSVAKVILVAIGFYVAFLLRDLLLAIVAAVVIASAIEPVTRWFEQYRIPRVVAVVFIYVAMTFIFLGSFYFLILPFFNDAAAFLASLPEYLQTLESWLPSAFGFSTETFQSFSTTFSLHEVVDQVNVALANVSSGFLQTASTIFGGVASFALIVVLSFYLSVQKNGIGNFLRSISPVRHRDYVADLWRRAQKSIGLWMQGQLLLVVLVGVLVHLGLVLLQVENALLLAFLAGIAELIPLFGPIIAAIPALIVASSQGGPTLFFMVLGFYLIVQQFENQLIYPLVVKKVLGVPAIMVILSLIAGATLAGFMGILLSVPLMAVAMELFKDLEYHAKADRLES